MSTSPTTPAALLRHLVASDPGRPRVTVYDDTDSPTRGERIELSARVLANWVAKAANLLRDDLDAGPGSVVLLDLPPHWRTLYWAFAAWSVGACVEVPAHRTGEDAASGAATPDVVVTDAVDVAEGADEAVLVTLAALARSASGPVPAGVVDEARELATHGDVFDAGDEPDPSDPALRVGGDVTAHGELLAPAPPGGAPRVHTTTADTAAFLRLALATWAADGSLVVTRGTPDTAVLDARLAAEGVTATA
ncbi:MAG TPA: TIGR03089 family protein [Ornithinibacter sp.]|nr:TIGR03089 family protein [Ornithinibacter sp.]